LLGGPKKTRAPGSLAAPAADRLFRPSWLEGDSDAAAFGIRVLNTASPASTLGNSFLRSLSDVFFRLTQPAPGDKKRARRELHFETLSSLQPNLFDGPSGS